MSRRSSWSIAVVLSLLLHAALFVALSRMSGPVPAKRTTVTEMDIVYVPLKAPPVAPPAPAPSPAAPQAPKPSRKPERPPSDLAKAPATPPSSPSTEPPQVAQAPGGGKQEDTPQADELPADAPRARGPAISLMPKGWVGGMPVGPSQSGRTLRNNGDAGPDPSVIAREQAEEAQARVDGWAADVAASARAESGAVNPYFTNLQDRFAKKLVNPPSPDLKVLGSRMKREQVEATERYGKTGTPSVAQKRDRRLEERNRMQAAVEAGRAAPMFMVDITEPILALAAVVEVRQTREGELVDLRVLEGSGDPKFDAWAVAHLKEALASADSPPESGHGLRSDGLRSRWRLEEYVGNPRVKVILIGVY
ncbi:TonB C-terminal domain-containing protein [Myxococcus sp. K38C18041901]|uniref:TonB C-terminal domain-containing protein n=1 Tax=Myxococcus guangdongensis TaxID=2906760 RepID=UPI0020A73848|nr:TonB C-terminal domain-containing protein [Myxococcus guangdongensis]MCP3058789.1 TonB C-terminal domain-containing protein [Myxococcus guangdongensis]